MSLVCAGLDWLPGHLWMVGRCRREVHTANKRTESSVLGTLDLRLQTPYGMLNADCLGLYGQVTKCIRWMPWQSEAMKDVVACDKSRLGGKQPVTRLFLNGETHTGLMPVYHTLNT